MAHLRKALDVENSIHIGEMRRKINADKQIILELESRCEKLDTRVADLLQKDQQRLELQQQAVDLATSELRRAMDEEDKRTQNLLLAENKRINDEALARIEANNQQNQVHISQRNSSAV